jgi:hydrogenase maturation factor
MCITRVGKVTSTAQGRASVDFFDGRSLDRVDVSMVKASRGDFVEVFGNLALAVLTRPEADKRRAAWREITKAAAIASQGGGSLF